MPQELKLGPRWTRLVASLLVVGACLLAPAAARAQAERFAEARQAYEDGEFERVVSLLETMVGGLVPTIRDPILIRESRKYLGAAYVLSGEPDLAARQFRLYLESLDPLPEDFELPNTRFPSQVNAVVRAVRDQILEARRRHADEVARAAREREERRRAALLELLDLARSFEVTTEVDPLPSYVPFGVGQFTNGDEGLGWFFAISEGLTFLLSGAALLSWITLDYQYQQAVARAEAPPVDGGFLNALIGTTWVAGGAFAVLAVAGVVEARIRFVPTRRRTIERPVPDRVLEELELAAGPSGVALRGRFW